MAPITSPKLAPYLVARDARGLIRFIETSIGGRLSSEESDPTGRLVHAEVRIADAVVMIGEVPPGRAAFPGMLHLYVEDAAAAFERALKGGATSVREVGTAPDGLDRGGVKDPWGNEWWFSSPTRPG